MANYQVWQLEGIPELLVCVSIERIQVDPNGPGEQDGVLGYDGQLVAELMKAEVRDVNSINLESKDNILTQNFTCKNF